MNNALIFQPFTSKGDLQINYGQRDGLAFNLDNADVTGFNQRLDYNPNQGDISTENYVYNGQAS